MTMEDEITAKQYAANERISDTGHYQGTEHCWQPLEPVFTAQADGSTEVEVAWQKHFFEVAADGQATPTLVETRLLSRQILFERLPDATQFAAGMADKTRLSDILDMPADYQEAMLWLAAAKQSVADGNRIAFIAAAVTAVLGAVIGGVLGYNMA